MLFINSPSKKIMIDVKDLLLIYPYTDPPHNRSIFRFPPLGLGYIASYLKERGFDVSLLDCTFMGEKLAIKKAQEMDPPVIGIYSMFTMREAALRIAKNLRKDSNILVAGGPLPSTEPEPFLDAFDIVAVGEGEKTMLDIVEDGFNDPYSIEGIVFRSNNENPLKSYNKVQNRVVKTDNREPIEDLNYVPLPARELFENEAYIDYYRKKKLAPTTSIMTSRGCPFSCDFCSRPIFGNDFRERSASNIADEVEDILSIGYEKVFFQDDCFTLTKQRVIEFCDEINHRSLEFNWDCLSRVDSMDKELADRMKVSGCKKIFFGLESGDDEILKLMKKSASAEQARSAVNTANSSGIKTGGFFILGYPGETDKTILTTINFALSLPLDYLSFSVPYPIPGTGLYEKTNDRLSAEKKEPKHRRLIDHELIYKSEFSEGKLRFAIFKGTAQFYMRKKLGSLAPLIEIPFDLATDIVFKIMS